MADTRKGGKATVWIWGLQSATSESRDVSFFLSRKSGGNENVTQHTFILNHVWDSGWKKVGTTASDSGQEGVRGGMILRDTPNGGKIKGPS